MPTTLQNYLDEPRADHLPGALKNVRLGAFLKCWVSPVVETVSTAADATPSLTKTPISGMLMKVNVNGTEKAWKSTGAAAAGQFTVSGKVLSLFGGEGHASTIVTYFTLEHGGSAGTTAAYTSAALALEFPPAPARP